MSHRSDVAFSPAVKQAQQTRGSRDATESRMSRRDWSDTLTPDLIQFVHERDSFYLSTASAEGQPYIQHRGGPPGFLTVLDAQTLAFADFSGNRQYVSVGNLTENDRVMLFLMDYPNRRRLKIWGTAESFEGVPSELRAVAENAGSGRVERIIVIRLHTSDLNCPQHITPRFTAEQIRSL